MQDGLEAAAPSSKKVEGEGEARDGRFAQFDMADLTAMRNLLRGGSVIDWHRLYFADRDQADRFLRVHEFDPENPQDMTRLEVLRDKQ